MRTNSFWLTFIIFANYFLSSLTLGNKATKPFRIDDLSVPSFVEAGVDTVLTCNYTSSQQLFRIGWLFNSTDEFYNFNPSRRTNEIHESNINGRFQVDKDASTDKMVVLRKVQLNATGIYRCKLSGPPPLMDVVTEDKLLTVGVIPKGKPHITGEPTNDSSPGDKIHMNCTSAPSIPEATLTWYINVEKAPSNYLVTYEPVRTPDNLIVRTLGLRFTLDQKHFKNGHAKFNCTAQINQTKDVIYSQSDEHSHANPSKSNETSAAKRIVAWDGAFFLLLFVGLRF